MKEMSLFNALAIHFQQILPYNLLDKKHPRHCSKDVSPAGIRPHDPLKTLSPSHEKPSFLLKHFSLSLSVFFL